MNITLFNQEVLECYIAKSVGETPYLRVLLRWCLCQKCLRTVAVERLFM